MIAIVAQTIAVTPDLPQQILSAIQWFKVLVEQEDQKLEEFISSLRENPQHAMEWSNETFQIASRIQVLEMILAYLTKEVTEDSAEQDPVLFQLEMVNQLIARLTDDVFRGARNPARSTSVASNLAKETLVEAQAEFLEKLVQHFRA